MGEGKYANLVWVVQFRTECKLKMNVNTVKMLVALQESDRETSPNKQNFCMVPCIIHAVGGKTTTKMHMDSKAEAWLTCWGLRRFGWSEGRGLGQRKMAAPVKMDITCKHLSP